MFRRVRKTSLLYLPILLCIGCSHAPQKTDRTTQAESTATVAADTEDPPPLEANLKRLLEKGYERYRRSDFAGAIQQWEPIWLVTGKPTDKWTPTLLFYCYLATGQYKKAEGLGDSNITQQPHSPVGYQQVGLALLWQGKNDAAEDSLRRSLEFDSHSAEVFFYLALALQRQGKKSESEKEFNRGETEFLTILQSNPADFMANYGLAYSYLYRSKKPEDAIKRIEAARESLHTNPDIDLTPDKNLYLGFYLPLLEGMYWSRTENPRASLDILMSALQNSPSGAKADLAEIYHFIGRDLKELGRAEASKEFLAKSVELDPNGPYAGSAFRSK